MANYTSSDFKRYGPNILTTDANRLALVKNPVKSDNYAQFQAKVIAEITFTAGDVAFADVGNDLRVTIAGEAGVDPSGTALITDDIAIAVHSTTTSKVHLVQNITDRAVTNNTGDTITIPDLVSFVREASEVV